MGEPEVLHYLKYMTAGFVLCAPVGPIGLLCLKRSLIEGRLAGFFALLGASTIDWFYCMVAGLGMQYLMDFLRDEQGMIASVGGVALIVVGIKVLISKSAMGKEGDRSRRLWGSFFTSFFLMLANPLPILTFSALFASIGSFEFGNNGSYLLLKATCVFVGSSLWGLILLAGTGFLRQQTEASVIRFLNTLFGLCLASFGFAAVLFSLVGVRVG